MKYVKEAKRECLARDCSKCRHCGSLGPEHLDVYQLTEGDSKINWQLSNLITLCMGCATAAKINQSMGQHTNRVGVLLCGGRGSRLFPLTQFANKHELPIGITPMVFYPLKTLRAFGVYRTLVVLDRNGASSIVKMLGSGKEFGLDISYKIQEGSGGISQALYLAKDFVKPGEEIVCALGDNIFDNDELDTSVNLEYDDRGIPEYKASVFTKKVDNPEDYGVAVLNNSGDVEKIIEKPKEFVSDQAVVGLYIYTNDVFRVIDSIKPSERGELEISDVNDVYANAGQLKSKEVTGYWGDAGSSIQHYAKCSMHGAKKANVSAADIDSFRSIVFDDK